MRPKNMGIDRRLLNAYTPPLDSLQARLMVVPSLKTISNDDAKMMRFLIYGVITWDRESANEVERYDRDIHWLYVTKGSHIDREMLKEFIGSDKISLANNLSQILKDLQKEYQIHNIVSYLDLFTESASGGSLDSQVESQQQ